MTRRVMVLDAEPVVRTTIADILTRGGYAVEPVATLETALESIRRDRPGLLITNVNLAGVTAARPCA